MDPHWELKLSKEGMVKQEPAAWVDSETLMYNGRLILTTKSLYFMVNGASKPAIHIDLDTINRISPDQIHTDHNILSLTYLQYDRARFTVLGYQDWEKAIESARMTPHIGKTNSTTIQGPATPTKKPAKAVKTPLIV